VACTQRAHHGWGNPTIVPAEHSSKIYILNSLELHELALRRYLGHTKYRHWKGIFEAVYFFREQPELPELPMPDPHHPGYYGMILRSENPPMIRVNRLCKAFWEFAKSIRIFMRCAVLHRQSWEGKASPHDFWVWCPNMLVGTYLCIQKFLLRFHNIDTLAVDAFGLPMAYPIRGQNEKVSFYMNLLQIGAWAEDYDWQSSRLADMRHWLFHGGLTQNTHFVEEMVDDDEMADPPMVSYAYNIAVTPYEELEQSNYSPEILPNTSDELGDLGINFYDAVTI
jgi:hypothetical protein